MTRIGDLDHQLFRYRAAIKAGARDLYLVPELGSQLKLIYQDFRLESMSEDVPSVYVGKVSKSGKTEVQIPRRLLPNVVLRHKRLVITMDRTVLGTQPRFYARSVAYEDRKGRTHELTESRALQLSLLQQQMPTLLPLCSWLSVIGQERGITLVQEIPNKKADAILVLQQRNAIIRKVMRGSRLNYWDYKVVPKDKRKIKLSSGPLLGLEIADVVYPDGVEHSRRPWL